MDNSNINVSEVKDLVELINKKRSELDELYNKLTEMLNNLEKEQSSEFNYNPMTDEEIKAAQDNINSAISVQNENATIESPKQEENQSSETPITDEENMAAQDDIDSSIIVQNDNAVIDNTNQAEKKSNLEVKIDNNMNKQADLQSQIDALNTIKDQMKTEEGKSVVEARINVKKEMLDKLKQKQVLLGSRQRSIVIKKELKEQKKSDMIKNQEEKVQSIEDKMNDNDLLKSNGLVSNVVSDVKGTLYQKQYDYNKNILNEMKNHNCSFAGANVMVVSKKVTNVLRSGMQKLTKTVSDGMRQVGNYMLDSAQQLNNMLEENYNQNINLEESSLRI